MKETVESLHKNVETFVNNRRSEGGQLLASIENAKSAGQNGLVDWERERLQQLMDRMSVGSASSPGAPPKVPMSASSGSSGGRMPFGSTPTSPPIVQQYANAQNVAQGHYGPGSAATSIGTGYLPRPNGSQVASPPPQQQHASYNPASWGPVSPPPQQQFFPGNAPSQQQPGSRFSQSSTPSVQSYAPPPGWQPPPPPPGAPPSQEGYNFGLQGAQAYPGGPGGYAGSAPRQPPTQQQGGGGQDPWSGLSGWK
jgi:hypothetical protein